MQCFIFQGANSKITDVSDNYVPFFKAADLCRKMAPSGNQVVQTDYKSALTLEEHSMLIRKIIAVFESDAANLPEGESRAKPHSSME